MSPTPLLHSQLPLQFCVLLDKAIIVLAGVLTRPVSQTTFSFLYRVCVVDSSPSTVLHKAQLNVPFHLSQISDDFLRTITFTELISFSLFVPLASTDILFKTWFSRKRLAQT